MLSKTEVDAELVQDELTKEHKLWCISDPRFTSTFRLTYPADNEYNVVKPELLLGTTDPTANNQESERDSTK